ncbi:hypothetical protein EAF04_002200 [Stromatinia cepivora]|nr:hypothetical protein EAF04_002200 [Stromatinia cepivora]
MGSHQTCAAILIIPWPLYELVKNFHYSSWDNDIVTYYANRCNAGGIVGVSGICSVPGWRCISNQEIDAPMKRLEISNAATDTGSGSWFRVDQEGYNQTLNANCGKQSFIIPSTLAPGAYLLRAEVMALYVARSVGGAQLYMSYFQLNVTGSGRENSFPGAYSANRSGNSYQYLPDRKQLHYTRTNYSLYWLRSERIFLRQEEMTGGRGCRLLVDPCFMPKGYVALCFQINNQASI